MLTAQEEYNFDQHFLQEYFTHPSGKLTHTGQWYAERCEHALSAVGPDADGEAYIQLVTDMTDLHTVRSDI